MGLFRRSPKATSATPPAIIASLDAYGRAQLDPRGAHLAGYPGEFEFDAWQASQADKARFVDEVCTAGLEQGGWGAYGAHRLVVAMVGSDVREPVYLDVLDTAIEFLQDTGRWPQCSSPLELQRLAERYG